MSVHFIRALIALVRPYWVSDERWSARGLLAAIIVAMNLALVYVNVLFSSWNNRFYDALRPRERWLITGPTGTGKSTLVRAIAGIWPFGRGIIAVPERARTLFLPQRSYLPLLQRRDWLFLDEATSALDEASEARLYRLVRERL